MEGDTIIVKVANCKKLNVRKKANKESEILTVLTVGDRIELKSSQNSANPWAKIDTGEVVGFVMKEYIEEE